MDPYMSIGAAAYEALLPQDLPTEALNAAMGFINDVLAEYQQPKSYGIILRHSPRLSQPTVPTILLGFPNITLIPTLIPPNPITNMPVLVVADRATPMASEYSRPAPMVSAFDRPTRPDGIHSPEKVGLSCISVGGRDCLRKMGSFGGWLATKDERRKLGLTCAHCLPSSDIGTTIVSPSTSEITSRLDYIIQYTRYCPESRPSICQSNIMEEEVEYLRARYPSLSDNDGVELRDGSKIKLVGPDLGTLVAKREHQSRILNQHNQLLQDQGKAGFALQGSAPLSRLDWAVFEGCESRILGNQLGPTDIFTDEKVFLSGNLEPGATVFKIGWATNQSFGIVNHATVMIWENGFITQELAILSAYGGTYNWCFADNGDSGSLVLTLKDEFEAVGLVVAKNESEIPRWTAVTPLWAVLEDVKNTLAVEVEFCHEFETV